MLVAVVSTKCSWNLYGTSEHSTLKSGGVSLGKHGRQFLGNVLLGLSPWVQRSLEACWDPQLGWSPCLVRMGTKLPLLRCRSHCGKERARLFERTLQLWVPSPQSLRALLTWGKKQICTCFRPAHMHLVTVDILLEIFLMWTDHCISLDNVGILWLLAVWSTMRIQGLIIILTNREMSRA